MCRVAYAETIIAITRHVGYHWMSSFREKNFFSVFMNFIVENHCQPFCQIKDTCVSVSTDVSPE